MQGHAIEAVTREFQGPPASCLPAPPWRFNSWPLLLTQPQCQLTGKSAFTPEIPKKGSALIRPGGVGEEFTAKVVCKHNDCQRGSGELWPIEKRFHVGREEMGF